MDSNVLSCIAHIRDDNYIATNNQNVSTFMFGASAKTRVRSSQYNFDICK